MQIRRAPLSLLVVAVVGPLLPAPQPLHAQWSDGIHVYAHTGNAAEFASETSGNQVQFWVKYYANDPEQYDLDDFNLTCTNGTGITGCSLDTNQVTLAPVDSALVTVTFSTTTALGTRTVSVTATGTFSSFQDTGGDSFEVLRSWDVDVTTLTANRQIHTETSGHAADFRVANTGYQGQTYTFTCHGYGPLVNSCELSPTSVQVASGANVTVTATYGAADLATPSYEHIYLKATGTSVADSSFHYIDVLGGAVDVKPDAGSAGPFATGVTGRQVSFEIINTGPLTNSYDLSCSASLATCTGLNLDPVNNVQPGDTVSVIATFDVGQSPGSGSVSVTADGQGGAADTGMMSFTVVSSADPITVEALTPPLGNVAAGITDTVFFLVTNNQGGPVTVVPTCSVQWGPFTCEEGGSFGLSAHQIDTLGVEIQTQVHPTAIESKLRLVVVEQAEPSHVDTADFEFHIHRYESRVTVLDTSTYEWPDAVAIGSSFSGYFLVENTGSIAATFALSCEVAPAGSCSPTPSSLPDLGPGMVDTVTVSASASSSSAQQAQVRYVSTTTFDGGSHADTATKTVSVPDVPTLRVEPVQGELIARPDAVVPVPFDISYGVDTPTQFAVALTCTEDLAGRCTLAEDTITVEDGAHTVVVTLDTGADGNTGRIEVQVMRLDSLVFASGAYDVQVRNTAWVTVDDASPGSEEIRGECVSISAGFGAIECDDYRYVYPLTPVSRLNRARNIGLVYNSGQAHSKRTIGAHITVPAGTVGLTAVKARLWIDGVIADSIDYPDSLFVVGKATRVAFALDESHHNGSPFLRYTVDAQMWLGQDSVPTTSVEGYLLTVDRDDELGEGWWVTGREQLEVVSDSVLGDLLVWTGGDGSSRLYLPDTAQANTWVGQGRGVPDTIVVEGGAPAPQAGHYLTYTDSQRVQVAGGQHSNLTDHTKMTWAFWVNPSQVAQYKNADVASIWGPWYAATRRWGLDLTWGRVRLKLYNNMYNKNSDAYTNNAVAANAWSFVVVQFDGTQPAWNGRIRMWIDGVAQALTLNSQEWYPSHIPLQQTEPFIVGKWLYDANISMRLGEFAVLDTLLSTTEATDWLTNGIDFTHPALVSAYRWSNDLTDASPSGNDLSPAIGTPSYASTTSYPSRAPGAGSYVRRLLGGGQVHYGPTGRHLKTVDRNGNETVFTDTIVTGKTRLKSIALPTPSGTAIAYDFVYASGKLDSIRVAGDPQHAYAVRIGANSRIDTLRAPDGLATAFSYDPVSHVLTEIRSPQGVVTRVAYQSNKVAHVYVESDHPTDSLISMHYWAASSVGLDSTGAFMPTERDSVSALFDGPRNVADAARFWVTGWGAIRGIRDALNYETWIERNGPYRTLVTDVIYPNNRILTAQYDSLGLMTSTTDHSTAATTTYQWNTTWRAVSQVSSPEGVVRRFGYDGSGNRIWESLATDTVRYGYTSRGQVQFVADAEKDTTFFAYDATRGNLESATSPLDAATLWTRDVFGRPVRIVTDIETGKTQRDSITYDVMGRETLRYTDNTKDGHWLRVRTLYDAYGRRQSVTPWADHPSQDSVSTGSTTWTYDVLDRVVVEEAVARDSLVYDRGGNVLERHTARGDTIRMEYDARGQLISRRSSAHFYAPSSGAIDTFPFYEPDGLLIPADTVTFTYDAVGNPLTVNNRHARITRTYQPNGLLATDELRIRDEGGTGFSTHVYRLAYGYDLDGRRTSIGHPAALGGGTDSTTYVYDDRGRIASIEDPFGSQYTFKYNARGQVTSKRFMGGGVDTLTYDVEGRVVTRKLTIGGLPQFDDAFTYDLRGKVLTVPDATMQYSGLGHLTYIHQDVAGVENKEWWLPNGFGQSFRDSTWVNDPSDAKWTKTVNTMAAGGLVQSQYALWPDSVIMEPDGWEGFNRTRTEDVNGNVYEEVDLTEVWDLSGTPPYTHLADLRREVRNYYSAEGRLMVHQTNRDSLDVGFGSSEDPWGVYEEYWYDGLGRRVLKRSIQEAPLCTVASRCESTLERVIWDGDQILWELRTGETTNGSGDILYVHGGGIDVPVGLVRNDAPVALHANWRGLYAFATNASGAKVDELAIAWPAGDVGARFNWDRRDTQKWYGSLVLAGRDASGYMYRRNRYYDTESGQFTQSDPIGIAGGLNLYGYADGDPVNYSDPYGLCVAKLPCPKGFVNAVAGFGDALSFGLTEQVRKHTPGGDNVDYDSGSYLAGAATEAVFEIAVTGGSALLKNAAKGVSQQASRRAARSGVEGFRNGRSGGVVHHMNPLAGHPGGGTTMFPTRGLPASVHSGSWNLQYLSLADHASAHAYLQGLESVVQPFFSAPAVALRQGLSVERVGGN